ncbi:MAG: hypothetical protein Q9163_001616 [Psora crenata]
MTGHKRPAAVDGVWTLDWTIDYLDTWSEKVSELEREEGGAKEQIGKMRKAYSDNNAFSAGKHLFVPGHPRSIHISVFNSSPDVVQNTILRPLRPAEALSRDKLSASRHPWMEGVVYT